MPTSFVSYFRSLPFRIYRVDIPVFDRTTKSNWAWLSLAQLVVTPPGKSVWADQPVSFSGIRQKLAKNTLIGAAPGTYRLDTGWVVRLQSN
jgi:hypothetical protein